MLIKWSALIVTSIAISVLASIMAHAQKPAQLRSLPAWQVFLPSSLELVSLVEQD